MISTSESWSLLRDTVMRWIDDRAPRKGAALAFYTLFSLTPLLTIIIAIAGAFFGREAVQGEIVSQIDGLIGEQGAEAVQGMIESAHHADAGPIASIGAVVLLLIGATTVFAELKDSLDQIWDAPAEATAGFWYAIKTRLLSFGLILVLGFLALVSLVLSAALAAFGNYWGAMFEGTEYLLTAVNFLVSFTVVTALFAAIYKLLPQPRIAWKDVWVGAGITALLFTIGKSLIGLYLGTGIDSAYGAAGSLIVVIFWVYYSAQIFLLGAEFTKLYADRYGSRQGQASASGKGSNKLRQA